MNIEKVSLRSGVIYIDSSGREEYPFPACEERAILAESLAKNVVFSSQVIHKTESSE